MEQVLVMMFKDSMGHRLFGKDLGKGTVTFVGVGIWYQVIDLPAEALGLCEITLRMFCSRFDVCWSLFWMLVLLVLFSCLWLRAQLLFCLINVAS
jgi:hypothetical protein